MGYRILSVKVYNYKKNPSHGEKYSQNRDEKTWLAKYLNYYEDDQRKSLDVLNS